MKRKQKKKLKKRKKSPKNQISISTQPKKKPMGYG